MEYVLVRPAWSYVQINASIHRLIQATAADVEERVSEGQPAQMGYVLVQQARLCVRINVPIHELTQTTVADVGESVLEMRPAQVGYALLLLVQRG